MAAPPVPSTAAPGLARRQLPLGAALFATSVPLVFLHVRFQPTVAVHGATADLSDLAVLAVAFAALAAGLREGFAPLRAGRGIWAAGGALLVLVFLSLLWGHAERRGAHLVTGAKFAEYALLAPAVPLLTRTRTDLRLLLAVLTGWSAVATVVGVLQFFGVEIAAAWPPGHRQPSLLGVHDFAALSGVSLAIALAALALGRLEAGERPWAWLAGASGTIGLVLSGATAAALGLLAAAAAAALLSWRLGRLARRRLAGIVAIAVAVALGTAILRAGDLATLTRFLGVRGHESQAQQADVQTFSQRTLLAYISLRIWLDHPLGGIGWQGSRERSGYGPYLTDAHRRFRHQPDIAFPSPEHPYTAQIAYVQTLADLGIVGLAALLGLLGTGLAVAARAALRGPPEEAALALLSLLVVMGVLGALGLVAGIPADAVLWLALGLAATAAARQRHPRV